VRKHKLTHLFLHSHLGDLLERRNVNCVFDVGANRGKYAERLREHGYTGRIVSFEPVRSTYERLAAAAADDPKWTAVHCALGETAGTQTIHVASSTNLSSLHQATDYSKQTFGKDIETTEETIEVKRLDALFDSLLEGIDDPRCYLKIDAQGHDLPVFLGARGVIDTVVAMQAELSVIQVYKGVPDFLEVLAAFREEGFEVTGMFPIGRDEASLVVREFDCVLTRSEG
jgi:FkbM family methyltransferase